MSGETDRRIEQLLAALRDDNEALRDHAVASLGQLGGAAIERLINLFADEGRVIREAARQAVVQVGADAVPALLEALRDDDWAVREQAAEALGSLKDERAIEPLIAALKDQDGAVRQAAVLALEKLRDPRARLLPARSDGAGRSRARAQEDPGPPRRGWTVTGTGQRPLGRGTPRRWRSRADRRHAGAGRLAGGAAGRRLVGAAERGGIAGSSRRPPSGRGSPPTARG